MKKIIVLLSTALAFSTAYCQDDSDKVQYTGDNFSLEATLSLFKKAHSIEEFEQLINQENNNANNLDLNQDGKIDYVTVDDIQQGSAHAIVLSTYINENIKQDIASIEIEKTGNENATLQIEGNKDLYPKNTIIEPSEITETISGEKGPSIGEIKFSEVVLNVWLWPSVQFLYAPNYIVWHSPWHWRSYPRWFKPWNPYRYSLFYSRCAPHRIYYRPTTKCRVITARKIYVFRRNTAPMIQNIRGINMINQKIRRGFKTPGIRTRGFGRR